MALQYDIIELTFLLKAIGFQLKSFEIFKNDTINNKDLVVDINCQSSGLKAKFVLSPDQCTCPDKPTENNNSFWEIQCKSPSNQEEKILTDSSCALLPPISKSSIDLGRSTLLMLLQHYRNELGCETKEKKSETFAKNSNEVSPLPSKMNADGDLSRFSTPVNMTSKTDFDGELTSIPRIKVESTENVDKCLLGSLPNNNLVSPIPVRNTTIPSVIFPSPQVTTIDTDRDAFIIETISKARKEIDVALLHLKCNITRDLSESSILANTTMPKDLKMLINSPKSSTSIDIRKDITSKALEHFQFSKPQPKKSINNSASSISKLKPTTATLKNRISANPGTPRPQVDLKATVEKGIAKSKILRSTSSVALKPSPTTTGLTKQKSALSMKK